MIDVTRPRGAPRVRGHRYAGGCLNRRGEERHYAQVVSLIVSLVAAAASAYAAHEASEAQSEAATYNRKIAEQQAKTAERNAAAEAAQVAERARRIRSRNLAALGGQGITQEGSPLLVMLDNAREAEMEARFALAGGQQRAQAFESEAKLFGFESKTSRRLGKIQAGATLLAGAAQAAGAARGAGGSGTQQPVTVQQSQIVSR